MRFFLVVFALEYVVEDVQNRYLEMERPSLESGRSRTREEGNRAGEAVFSFIISVEIRRGDM